jgi:hypothetical protein
LQAALTTAKVTDLNADLLDGKDWRSPDPIGNVTPNTVAATTLTCALLNATAAFSTLKVTNLNCDLLDDKDWSAPASIGNVTPASVKSTTLESTGLATLASAKVSNLTPSSYVSTDASNNLISAAIPAAPGFTNTRWNHAQSTWIAGVATTLALVNSGYGLVAQFNGPGVPALNDEFRTIAFQIAPGTYTLNVVSSTLNNRGIANFYLDASGVSFGSIDLYNNAGLGTVVLTVAAVVIPASTNNSHSLRVVVTKNGLSGGYFMTIGEMWFK